MRGRITVSLKYVQKSLTSSIGAMESIKSDANVANVQCFYPLPTGQCCILWGSEFYFKSNYYSVGFLVKHPVWLRSQINISTVFILDELSSKYFQSVAEDKNVCGAIFKHLATLVLFR